ncbi:MAG: F0F1 ATP synthase subunit B [Actinomycetaceae bacterium]|nr:F0F1 ATP synthase subunit B [Actinomycetaceae bacterium]
MTFLPAAAETAEQPNILLPPLYDIVWQLIALIIIGLVLYKYALPKFNAILDERAQKIEEGLSAADRAKEAEALAKRKAEELMAEANADAGRIRADASEDAKAIIAAARKDAEAEAERVLSNAQRQILAERQAAEISLRSEVGLLATELAEKIVGEHLKDTELTSRIVDRFLDDLESETTVQES